MNENSSQNYQEKMIEAFIDKPLVTLWYQLSFLKFNINGVDTMKWNWSWWAFGGGFLYLLYRKQYVPSLILFIASMTIGMVPMLGLLLMILSGGYSSYFVYKGYKTKLTEIETVIEDEEERFQTMRAVGGYHQWVIWVYATVMSLSMLIATYIIYTAIASIP